MPKAWDDNEKELIKATLIKEGRTIFEKYGIHKATVDDIVQASQISKGAFYQFYDSKELLYLDVFDDARHEFCEILFNNAFPDGVSRKQSFRTFLNKMAELITRMPIYTQLNSSLIDYLSRKLPEELLYEKLKKEPEETNRYFSQWIERGWINLVDLKALNGMFLEFVIFIKRGNEAGVENFDAVKNIWIEMFTNYLIVE